MTPPLELLAEDENGGLYRGELERRRIHLDADHS